MATGRESADRKQIVHVIDDDAAVLGSVRFLLSIEGFEAKTYTSAEEFLEAVGPSDTGIVVTDVRLPGLNGVELIEGLKKRGLNLPVIVITAYADVALAVSAMKQGAIDLLEKPFDPAALILTIRQALEGVSEKGESVATTQAVRRSLSSLSAREKGVLEELIKGKTNKAIAAELGISQRTVEVHRANIMKKTEAGSLSALVRMALIAEKDSLNGSP
ncbi:response regulator transcription factor [Methylocystis bryophila]|uniref:response regulator transcription factor n=1 Tax=Methylocystis bryophila TaxID=655015 RepID=UPI001FD88F3D|nr:response regulator [Methylocystis bryophila]BDV37179.1 DNA-binding response regulator [Methylocystis bryophila]